MKHLREAELEEQAEFDFSYIKVSIIVACICGGAWFLIRPYFEVRVGRNKPMRVKVDLRSFATAIESYYVDHKQYPAHDVIPEYNIFGSEENIPNRGEASLLPTFAIKTRDGQFIHHLTTPVSYITSPYFVDPFGGKPPPTYWYWRDPENNGWIAWSPGPDLDYDIDMSNVQTAYDPLGRVPSEFMLNHCTYDPTNGSVSSGDIYRTKQ